MEGSESLAVLFSAYVVLVGCAAASGADTGGAGSQPSTDASSETPGAASEPADTGFPLEPGGPGDASSTGGAGSPESDAAASESRLPEASPLNAGRDAGGARPDQCANRAPVASTWTLAWSDEFENDGAPDPANWVFESGFVRNQELQWYQPSNATVTGGLLTIAAQRQQVTNPSYVAGSTDWTKSRQYAEYASSSMTTSGKHSFQYGRFEMCARIDTRLGSWPAFWILGNGRGWPSSGEVDIMEYYANGVRANVCIPSGGNCDWSGSVSQSLPSLGATWPAQFHLWAMEWNATDVNLYLDDKLVYDFKISRVTSGTNPYTGNPFYMIINLAIGANGGDPSDGTFPMTYEVDYVRVYQ